MRTSDGSVLMHEPTELVSLGMHDAEGRDLGVRVIEEPNPDAGRPVMFERGYTHHDGYGARNPAHRREGLPDGLLLTGLEQQFLAVLDHWHTAPPFPGEPVKHLRAIGAAGPAWQWFREPATLTDGFMRDYDQRRNRRPWKVVRRRVARLMLAAVLGEDEGTIRRRIQNHGQRHP